MSVDEVDIPAVLPHVKGSETSEESARKLSTRERAVKNEHKIKDLLAQQEVTCDQAEVLLDIPHHSCSSRFSAMKKRNEIHETGKKRVTRYGNKAAVYALGPKPETDLLHWRPRGLSWTMFRIMVSCPKQAEYAVRDRLGDPSAAREQNTPTFHADAGTIVQKLYELYFNQGVNLRDGGTTDEVVARCATKVMASPWAEKILEKTTYPEGKTHKDLLQLIATGVAKGRKALFAAGLLDKEMKSEVNWSGTFEGFSVFSRVDFVVETPRGAFIYDGKINGQANADPRQLWYAALARRESGRPVLGAGFLYWKLGKFVSVPVDDATLEKFIKGDFAEGRKRWLPVMGPGVESLDPTPSFSTCRFCAWNGKCPSAQMARARTPDYNLPDEIDWGDIA